MRSARAVAVAIALALCGCSSSATLSVVSPRSSPPESASRPASTTARSTARPPSAGTLTSRPAPPTGVQRVLAGMSEAERVGQLFMVGASSTGPDPAALGAINDYHVGSVILTGTSNAGVSATAAVSAGLQRAASDGVRLLVAADQEGGQVQRLRGPGFDTIPSAVQQGGLPARTLRADARRWGGQLRAAGINVNLAPVLDTVPRPATNPPIGQLDREYGADPATVAEQGTAFAQGLADAGIDATLKHFPGLGRVTGNTDTTAGVTDSTTTGTDAYLTPFAAGIASGAPFVMLSTAYYSRIDPANPAAFSPAIVTGLLRGRLHYRGVVVSDDVGVAEQVASIPPAQRAVRFLAAGGDIVLTVVPGQIAQMTAAVLARARSDAAFHAQVDAAALRVLTAKQAQGLLG